MQTKDTIDLSPHYWDNRYINLDIGWDVSFVSTPLKNYIDSLKNKGIHVLIPGCGNAYEAEYLLNKGFKNITLLDVSKHLVEKLKKKFENTSIRILEQNFFDHIGTYDLILEQTFFCAIHPSLRNKYAQKMYELLSPQGVLAGVLFNTNFEKPGPPFGGNKEEYEQIFLNYFTFKHFEQCKNSIEPRKNKELFIEIFKKEPI